MGKKINGKNENKMKKLQERKFGQTRKKTGKMDKKTKKENKFALSSFCLALD